MSARRSTSLRDSSAESERMEGTGSWDDPFDWFKLEHPASRSVSHYANYKCLLEAERVLFEGRGVVLINTDEAGTLIVTNFRLIFLSEGTENIIVLGTIPLATIEKFSKMAQNPFSTEVFHFTLGNEHNDWGQCGCILIHKHVRSALKETFTALAVTANLPAGPVSGKHTPPNPPSLNFLI
ncbi:PHOSPHATIDYLINOSITOL-3-PHOSPHATASE MYOTUBULARIN-1 [Salix koriyanagi]|uniref:PHOSPHATIDYLINOSITOL-3-PHOSPHATASE MYOTUBULARIN-1 n=1 Tax=Salix koriyanagi TaxID=2511006 RepID=A0A9Q0WIL2_9ROSI|nr:PHOSPHATIDYLINOSITOL-3-PHOSPHATASE MYOTUBULARIN-1 [Salix koriyanagi]